MTRVIALMALAALELSDASVHESVHARALSAGHPVTMRNITLGTAITTAREPGRHGADGFTDRSPAPRHIAMTCTNTTGSASPRRRCTPYVRDRGLPGSPSHGQPGTGHGG